MWTNLKCTICKEEYADSDISQQELENEDIVTDEKGNYLTVCNECN